MRGKVSRKRVCRFREGLLFQREFSEAGQCISLRDVYIGGEAVKAVAHAQYVHFDILALVFRQYREIEGIVGLRPGDEMLELVGGEGRRLIRRADERLPLLRSLPLRHKAIICEPLLGAIDFRKGLGSWCEKVIVGGESGKNARLCDYRWVLQIREQCQAFGVPFRFKQTGAYFCKSGRFYRIERRHQHEQARLAGIDWDPCLEPLSCTVGVGTGH